MSVLGYVANSPLGYDGQRYWYQTGEWRVLEALSLDYGQVVVCAPIEDLRGLDRASTRYAHLFDLPNARVVHLSSDRTVPGPLGWIVRRAFEFAVLWRESRAWTVGFLMAPGWTSVSAWLARAASRWPYGIYFRGDWPSRVRARNRRWRRLLVWPYVAGLGSLERRLLQEAAVRVTEGQLFASKYPSMSEKIIPSVTVDIPLKRFRRHADRCEATPIRLIGIGNLEPHKGIRYGLEAVAELARRGIDVTYTLVGTGPAKERLEAYACELGIESRVNFVGYVSGQEAVFQQLEDADILLVTSLTEGFPRVIYEAMSQSVLVVATRVGAIPANLRHGDHALLVPPADSDALVAAIERLAEDEKLRKELLNRAFALAWSTFETDPNSRVVRAMRRLRSDAEHHHEPIGRK